jgi:glucose-6-phosphate 1-dehydrogenase
MVFSPMNIPSSSIAVIGASGDLSRKKVFPALFALYCQKLLPKDFHIVGFSRSRMDGEAFRESIARNLTCRYTPEESCAEKMDRFLARCFYLSGDYDSRDSFEELGKLLTGLEKGIPTNRLFYMAIPPFLFLGVSHALKEAGLVSPPNSHPGSRAVIEKPFGTDRSSSDDLVRAMGEVFSEDQIFRIDHYLGKEVIQNLLILRFANLIFDPIWTRESIDNVQISWMEDLGTEGRAGYFDQYGIVRDVMQNHLLQMLALIAMEQPVSLSPKDIRDEKVKVLRSVLPLRLEDMAFGQYTRGVYRGGNFQGYLEEEGVPAGSRTPTFAAAALQIRNRRWDGVPFLMRAGKGLDRRLTEIRIQFRQVPGNLFAQKCGMLSRNELHIRVQPDEGIAFEIMNKVPGLEMKFKETQLDLRYHSSFEGTIPDAYECLLLDVLENDQSLFIREDELAAAWDVFTPALRQYDRGTLVPENYPFGSSGPSSVIRLAEEAGVEWSL